MGEAVGTINRTVLDGVTYSAMADVNLTINRTKYEIEGVATTGQTLYKYTLRVRTIEGLTLGMTPAEVELLKDLSDSKENTTLSVELADGSVYRAVGRVYFENYETDSGQGTVTLIPSGDWTPFLS